MKDILAKAQRARLAQFVRSNVLLAFDFDGTLAPIVREPALAQLRSGTLRRLARVAERYPCTIISGRARADVESRVSGLPLASIIGNHGLEPSRRGTGYVRLVRSWERHLKAVLGKVPGVEIENKGPSLAIHYRKCIRRKDALDAIDRAARSIGPFRQVPGKLVVNLLPEGAAHKGIALLRARRIARAESAIYVGDDVTDEDVFQLEDAALLGIRIGASRLSAAHYFIKNQQAIDAFLDVLLRLRHSGPNVG